MFFATWALVLSVTVAVSTGELQLGAAVSHLNSELSDEYEAWLKENSRCYASSDERNQRFENFARNAMLVQSHNAQENKTYTLRLNKFADLSNEEFRQQKLQEPKETTTPTPCKRPADDRHSRALADVPETLDWRDQGCVSPVREDDLCKADYAFTIVGAIEGAYCVKHGKKLEPLSAQQIISCDEDDLGCGGGWAGSAIGWILGSNGGGVCSAEEYPFKGAAEECKSCTSVVTATDDVSISSNDVEAMKQALATIGPLTAAIAADLETFQLYNGGVYSDPNCHLLSPTANVLVVGYGRDAETQQDYWLVKMNWGTWWGEDGYIRMATYACGIAEQALYVTVE